MPQAWAEEKYEGKPGIVAGSTITFQATVESINYKARTVKLKGPQGKIVDVKVSDVVKNFDQINKGDLVNVEYYKSVALFVRKANEAPVAEEEGAVLTAPKGEKPAGVEAEVLSITATVEVIDYDKRIVVLKNAEGDLSAYNVPESVKRFKEIKAGDEVVLQITEALAIAVTKPQ